MTTINQRVLERMKCFLKATILYQHRNSTMDCVVRNISPLGAKVVLDAALAIPIEFELEVPQRGTTYKCVLKWRHGNEVGVQFKSAPVDDTGLAPIRHPSTPDQEHMHVLAEDNANLRRTIAELKAELAEVRRQPEPDHSAATFNSAPIDGVTKA